MPDKTTLNETDRTIDGTEAVRLATTGANWKATLSAIKAWQESLSWVYSNSISATNGYKIGGVLALNINSTNRGTFVGENAGALVLSTDTKNTALGRDALAVFTGGGADSANSAFGYGSCSSLITGKSNTAVGDGTLFTAVVSNNTVCIGAHAGLLVTVNDIIAIGEGAMDNTAGGVGTISIGRGSGRNVTGANNVLIGKSIANALIGGATNIAIGDRPLASLISGNNNIGIGQITLFSITTTSNNVGIGDAAGQNTTGSGGVFIGHNAGLNETASNKLYIANTSTATPLIGGDFSAGTLNFGGTGAATFGGDVIHGGVNKLKSYTVATVPSASAKGAGSEIYVSDESGGAVPAFSDTTNWRRVTDRAVIS